MKINLVSKSKKQFVLLYLVILILGLSIVYATDAILVRKSGDVELMASRKKNFIKVPSGTKLSFGDTIQTHKNAKAQILFSDGNAILLKESSSLRLSEKQESIQIFIPQGEFLIGLKKKMARGKISSVRTPAAIASVRGTLFWGLSDEKLNSTYACFQHEIEISAKGRKVILKAGEKTFIPYGQAPQKKVPANVPLDYLDTFEIEGSIEEFKEMLKE